MRTHRPRASSPTNRRAARPRQALAALALATTAAFGAPAHAADPAAALGQVTEVRAMRRLAAQALRPMIGFDRLEGQPELQQHAIADFYRRVVRVQQATRAYARRGGLAGDFAYQIDAAYQNLVHRDYRGPLSPSVEKTRLAARYLVRGLYLSGVAAPPAEEGLGGRVLRELRELERVDRALTNLFTLDAPQTRRTPPVVVVNHGQIGDVVNLGHIGDVTQVGQLGDRIAIEQRQTVNRTVNQTVNQTANQAFIRPVVGR